MGLKIKVKVSEINNLSDARYCAGMGVDMIGFSLDEQHEKYIQTEKVLEIANWLTGVKVVGEFGACTPEIIDRLSSQLPLDYLQVDFETADLKIIEKSTLPVILRVSIQNNLSALTDQLQAYKKSVSLFLLENDQTDSFEGHEKELTRFCQEYNVLLGYGITKDNLDKVLTHIHPKGIALKGGVEIRPGLKDFEDLSEILDLLEVEDY